MVKGELKNKCTVCGSEQIEYGDTILKNGLLGYEAKCDDCGATGKEWYTLEFVDMDMSA